MFSDSFVSFDRWRFTMAYLNLSSRDSKTYHPNNSSYDFTVELPWPIEGLFKCGLMEFTCASMVEDLYVFTDICEPEYVHDKMLPLLRIVTEPGELGVPHFKPVSRQVIQRVRIYIRSFDDTQQDNKFIIPSHDIGNVRVTLGFERI